MSQWAAWIDGMIIIDPVVFFPLSVDRWDDRLAADEWAAGGGCSRVLTLQ